MYAQSSCKYSLPYQLSGQAEHGWCRSSTTCPHTAGGAFLLRPCVQTSDRYNIIAFFIGLYGATSMERSWNGDISSMFLHWYEFRFQKVAQACRYMVLCVLNIHRPETTCSRYTLATRTAWIYSDQLNALYCTMGCCIISAASSSCN